ncbi:hypothetical protein [Streptomyces sp. LaBMicrA B280]|uniref:hypothetical protein n=1 Tax=Streptomyces sp. LaBMicrA B280 TaxID=3391001 RepID=UPI003BA512F1
MSNRSKRTLMAAARGTAMVFVLTALQLGRGASLTGLLPWLAGWTALFAAITWYTWWYYGDSPKALTLQAKAEAKRLQRLGR